MGRPFEAEIQAAEHRAVGQSRHSRCQRDFCQGRPWRLLGRAGFSVEKDERCVEDRCDQSQDSSENRVLAESSVLSDAGDEPYPDEDHGDREEGGAPRSLAQEEPGAEGDEDHRHVGDQGRQPGPDHADGRVPGDHVEGDGHARQ